MNARRQPVDEVLQHIGPRAEMTRGYVEGVPVRSLCGLDIAPTCDPTGLPACSTCRRVLEQIRSRHLN